MATLTVNIRLDEYDVYIGRAGYGKPGTFGNPFVPEDTDDRSRADCLSEFRTYFEGRLTVDPEFRVAVLALRGKRLGCFCAPKGGLMADSKPHVCHGQIIAEFLDTFPEDYQGGHRP